MDKDKLYKVITEILNRGNNVEIRKKPDGTMQVFEIKKKTIAV